MARILKQDAERMMANVSHGHEFRCSDGRMLRNMRDLEKGLQTMTDETFSYHSNADKTDFSNWVNDVIGDEKLARDLRKSPDKIVAAKNVASRIAFLDSKLG
jgi:hypothetical protein